MNQKRPLNRAAQRPHPKQKNQKIKVDEQLKESVVGKPNSLLAIAIANTEAMTYEEREELESEIKESYKSIIPDELTKDELAYEKKVHLGLKLLDAKLDFWPFRRLYYKIRLALHNYFYQPNYYCSDDSLKMPKVARKLHGGKRCKPNVLAKTKQTKERKL